MYEKIVIDYYPQVVSIENPFDPNDRNGFTTLTGNIGQETQIVGCNLLVSNPTKVDDKACNTLSLKIDQIGTVSEAIEVAKTAQEKGWGVLVSHAIGETEDTFIADLAVGLGVGQIKAGAP